MATTYSIDGTGGTAVDVSIHPITQDNLVEQSYEANTKDGVFTRTYLLPGNDQSHQSLVRVQTRQDPKDPNGTIGATVAYNTWARAVDTDGDVISLRPVSCVIAINVPPALVEVDDLSLLVANTFSLTYESLTAKVRATGILNKLMNKINKLW